MMVFLLVLKWNVKSAYSKYQIIIGSSDYYWLECFILNYLLKPILGFLKSSSHHPSLFPVLIFCQGPTKLKRGHTWTLELF